MNPSKNSGKDEEWMRRRIRLGYWKQWQKIWTWYKMLRRFGIEESKAWEYANTRKGYWRNSKSPILNRSLDNQTIINLGYIFFFYYYQRVMRKLENRRVPNGTHGGVRGQQVK